MTVEQRLTEIEARLKAATPGPWVVEDFDARTQAVSAPTTREYWVCIMDNAGPTAAEFIAHSRADVEWLLAEVDRLTAERHGWELEARYQHEDRLARVAALSEENAQLRAALADTNALLEAVTKGVG